MTAKLITDTESFAAIFSSSTDGFLLCHEGSLDGVTAEALSVFEKEVLKEVEKNKTAVCLYFWDCSSDHFKAAKQQLDKTPRELLLVVIYKKEIADTVRATSLEDILSSDIPRLCKRLASFQKGGKIGTVESTTEDSGSTTTTTVRVDVAKMVGMGKKLMSEGQSFYAEKFFVKALEALDAVSAEVKQLTSEKEKEDYDGSVAMCLAWAGLAQMVQGKSIRESVYLKRLNAPEMEPFVSEPMSDACRVVTTQHLMLAAPMMWTGETCSRTKLSEKLTQNPEDHASRSMLVITYFMSGDLERALTEAVKLHTLQVDFGRVALKRMVTFLGENHVLVQQLGPLKPSH